MITVTAIDARTYQRSPLDLRKDRVRQPVAPSIASAMATGAGTIDGSPTPLAPKGRGMGL
jgi:hypothetical protein